MQDDFHGPVWAEHHRQVTDMIHKIFSEIMAAFVSLNAVQFDAPWRARRRPGECN